MKIIPIKTQKIICFIPIINFLTMFIWIYNYEIGKIKRKLFYQSLLFFIITGIAIILIDIGISELAQNYLYNIISDYALIYIIPLFISFVVVKFQEKKINY